jgi:hypothetical protein
VSRPLDPYLATNLVCTEPICRQYFFVNGYLPSKKQAALESLTKGSVEEADVEKEVNVGKEVDVEKEV